jgi:DNA polymerase
MLEIATMKPKIIVPLGRHALTSFFTKLSITAAHGKPQSLRQASIAAEVTTGGQGDMSGITIFPIYHPAAALHNPGLRDALYADFKALGEFLTTMKKAEA